MTDEAIFITALGASTPIGRDAWSSAAAVRAGISGFGDHPYMIDTAGEPMRVARADWLETELTGAARFESLLMPAIDQVLEPWAANRSNSVKTFFALGLPSRRPGLPDGLGDELMHALGRRYGALLNDAESFPYGHAAGLLALEEALKKLKQGEADACVVASVDSYLAPETLEWLEECDQLHGAGPLNNAWGFIPGEAAGALLVMRADAAKNVGLPTLARVLGAGSAHEAKRIKTETVCIGEGLTQAFRLALRALPDNIQVSDVYCDMNGEPYRGDEFGFACLRTKEAFVSPSDFVAPADCWGDVAAAGGPLHTMLATIAGLKSYANGSIAFVWGSAEDGQRAAALVATGWSA